MKLTKLILSTFILVFCIGATLYADSNETKVENDKKEIVKKEVKKNEKNAQENKSTQSGSQVFIDPDTGEFITREEAVERGIVNIEDSLIFAPEVEEEILEVPLPGGGSKAKLPQSHNHTMKVSVDKNGDLKSTCDH